MNPYRIVEDRPRQSLFCRVFGHSWLVVDRWTSQFDIVSVCKRCDAIKEDPGL